MSAIAQLYVTNQRIDCPNRGNINLDICLFCENLINVNLDNVHPFIRCVPPAKDTESDRDYSSRSKTKANQRGSRYSRTETVKSKTQPTKSFGQDRHVIEKVVSTSMSHPEWGINRVTETVQQQGIVISRRKVGEIFKNHSMVYKDDRLKRLLSLATNEELELDSHQAELLEKYDICFHDRRYIGKFPGHRLIQTSVTVPAKSVTSSLYADIVIDTFSGYTFGHIHKFPSRSSHVMLLQQSVFPVIMKFTSSPETVFTPSSSIFAHRQFTEYLTTLHIRQEFFTEMPGCVQQFWSEFLEPWVKTVPAYEFVREANLQPHFQRDLDTFNHSYPLPGFPHTGRSPQDRIDEYLRGGTDGS